MSFSKKSESRIKNGTASFISMDDIWKEKVVLDAIITARKVKNRVAKIF